MKILIKNYEYLTLSRKIIAHSNYVSGNEKQLGLFLVCSSLELVFTSAFQKICVFTSNGYSSGEAKRWDRMNTDSFPI